MTTEAPRTGRRRRWLRGIATLGLVVVGTLVALEIGLRVFGYGTYIVYRPDERLFWVPLENQRGRTEAGREPITINADGFRYPVALGHKAPEEVRVFAFGDSVTMGWGVPDDATYCAVLERLLDGAGDARTDFRVVSAGVNAYPNALVVERFKRVVEQGYEPDVAVIAFSFNTGFEYVPTLTGDDKTKFLRRVAMKGLVRRFALHNFFIEEVLRDLVYYRLRATLMYGTWENVPRKPDVSGFVAGLEDAKRFADAHGVRLVFLILATDGQKDGLHPYQQAMMDVALAQGVPAVDMVAALRGRDHASLFMDHAHPSREGHALIAAALEEPVRRMADTRRGHEALRAQAPAAPDRTGTP